jgi:predicted dehydrogenase (TIGR03970 family)
VTAVPRITAADGERDPPRALPGSEDWDVVVVGAGTAGCPLAARLADAGRRVLLLEAGADHPFPTDFPPVLRDPARMGAAVPGHPANWNVPGTLLPGLSADVPRGRVVGGSSALNAGYFIRAARADLDEWGSANPLWAYDRVLPAFRRLEADLDFGDAPEHGSDGPLPVARVRDGGPLAEAFAAAATELGFPAEPDKNGNGGAPGYGPVPLTTAGGVRVNTAMAYLSPRRTMPGLTVRGGVHVRRVVVEHGRAVGVQTDEGIVRAAEVVLSAGAVGSAHLLLRTGIGPADDLRAAGVDVVADLPGVGADFTDHPIVYVGYRPARALPERLPLHGVLHATSPDGPVPGDLEILPWLLPFARITGAPGGDELVVGVGLQREDSRGRLTLDRADPSRQPRLDYRYLGVPSDRRRLRDGVRLAVELLRTAALRPLVAERTGLPDDVLAVDRHLDEWIRRRLTTAVHLSGTARMGPDGDPGAVVDQELRVRGVTGLRVVDTSVLPQVPTRGPAATAVMLGERAAELMVR